MYEQIITMFSSMDYMAVVANDINALAGMFDRICPVLTTCGLSPLF